MEPAAHDLTAPPGVYEVGGQRFETTSQQLAEAIAAAHAAHHRPRCMCVAGGVAMYVARLNGGFIVKRMPHTGSQHAPGCPSYEPPADFSGLGQVLGSAISEDPATGETTLKLDFPLSKAPGRSIIPAAGGTGDSVVSDGTRLSLRGLLHYLWDQAELTRWQPGFEGKRSWSTVRKHLLQAAEHKTTRGQALQARLYIPEPFSVEQRDAINARRLAQWAHAISKPHQPQQLMLIIAELKEIVPARYAYKAVIKHVPDQAFVLDEPLYRRLGRRFEAELSLWGASDSLHMVMIASFSVSEAGVPTIVELSLMPVSLQWLPIEDSFEHQLIERLVQERRAFVKGLRYNLPRGQVLVNAILTDTGDSPQALCIVQDDSRSQPLPADWVWSPANGAMPPPPTKQIAIRHPALPTCPP
jgi:hypothetical protein